MRLSKKRKIFLLCSGVVLAVILVSCAGIPTRKERAARRDLQAAEQAYRPQRVKPELPRLSEDSTLADLMRYALLNNPRVESTFYDWKAAVEKITTERSLPDPMLQFDIEFMSGVVESLTPMLMNDPMSNIPGPGKLGLRADAAYGEALKQRAAFENELLATALSVKRAYYQLWALDQQIYWTGEILKIVDDVENIARERLSTGNVTQQDVLRAQIERDKLQNDLVNLEDSRSTIIARLKSALGLSPDLAMPAVVAKLEPTPADFTEQSLLDEAFERNPQLKGMQAEVLQAISLYQLSKKSNVPDFSFSIGSDVKASPAPIMPSVGITLPIWRDKVRAEIARGEAGMDAASARLSAEQLELAVRFAEAAYSWRENDRNVSLYNKRLIPKAKASLDSARAGYAGGITNFIDLLDAEKTLLEYRIEQAASQGQREIILAEMSLVILGRWPEDVMPILNQDQAADIGHSVEKVKGKR